MSQSKRPTTRLSDWTGQPINLSYTSERAGALVQKSKTPGNDRPAAAERLQCGITIIRITCGFKLVSPKAEKE
jgi:hypothetical protein